jgi:hypothetical protein
MSTIKVDTLNEKSTNGNIAIIPTGSGKLVLDGLTWPHADGTTGQTIVTNASGVLSFADAGSGGFTVAALQDTTSGTSVTFGSIPTGVTQVVIMFSDVRFSGGGITALIQIGDSGGIETSGYTSGSTALWQNTAITSFGSAAGFNFRTQDSTGPVTGTMTLNLQKTSTFKWVQSHALKTGSSSSGDNGDGAVGGGAKALSAELTQLKFSGGTFTHGAIAVMYQ